MKRPWHALYDEQVPVVAEFPDVTMVGLFEDAVRHNPGGTATLFFNARISYRDLGIRVDRFSSALAVLGVKPGDRVALILPNLPAYPIAHFAVMKRGAILVPTNPLYVERELAYQLNDSGAETVVVYDKLLPKLEKVRDQTRVKNVIVVGVQDFLPGLIKSLYLLKNKSTVRTDRSRGIILYRDFVRASHPPAAPIDVKPEDTAIFLYTGGTTGISKGAVLTHRNLVANVLQTKTWLWSLRDKEEVLLCVLPFFHSYGMTTGLHLSVATGSAMLLVPRFELAEVVKRIRRHKPTVFCGVPSMYNAINHFPSVSSKDVGSIRLCISGGSALPEEVQKRFEGLTGGKLVEGYGLSETSPVTHVNPIAGHRKIGSIGAPVINTDAVVVDPVSRKPVPPGTVGELAIKGPQVMKGYWNMPEETGRVLREGWFYTGDLAVMDERGFFSIVDRIKDLIISAGMNIYPREVEEVLHQHPKIMEAAVIGIPSRVREEIVKAFIVPKPGEQLSKQDVILFCRDKLAKFKIPKEIEFREQLPKSTVGKILKRVLKEEEEKKNSLPHS